MYFSYIFGALMANAIILLAIMVRMDEKKEREEEERKRAEGKTNA